MTFRFRAFFLFFLVTVALQAQDNNTPGLCGTPPGNNVFLKKYAAHPQAYPDNADTLYAGVQIHLVARDNGSARLSAEKMLDAFCQLNLDFTPSNIQFFFKNDWNLLDNTKWFQHDSIEQGIAMMLTNNAPDALNAYFMNKAAGNAGYNLPYAGVAVRNQDAAYNNHTWTHEVGHALALEHTFIGWENTPYNPNNPTPDTLTYNYTFFHDTLDTTIPAPLDTALVEYVDGSNCGIAADRICDTKPDYLAYRWECDGQAMSTVVQKDPAGVSFKSDGTLYMSYANDHCQTRFSATQSDIMRAYLQTVKSSWLAPEAPAGPVTGATVLQAPINSETAPASGAALRWTSVPGATHYLVQVSRFNTFVLRDQEVIVTDTTLITKTLLPNINYYWKVRPFNVLHTCAEFSSTGAFKTVPVTAVQAATEEPWRCYPTVLEPGTALTVELPASWLNQKTVFQVFDAAGRQMWQSERALPHARLLLDLPQAQWPAGLYRLVGTSARGVLRQTLVVARG
ncbi:MAG: hypothetical protein IT260_14835 [Saprospiraceae bacterium]|nr:hypothetical protein [Saprospiraceae bacterium]